MVVLTRAKGPRSVWVSGPAIRDPLLTAPAFRLWCLIRFLAGAKGQIHWSQEALAAAMTWSLRKVQSAIKLLKKLDYIIVTQRSRKGAMISTIPDTTIYGDRECRWFLKLLSNKLKGGVLTLPSHATGKHIRHAEVCGPPITDPRLGDGEFRLLCFLRFVRNPNGNVSTWGQPLISKAMSRSSATIQNRIATLKKLGMVRVQQVMNQSNRTVVPRDPAIYGKQQCIDHLNDVSTRARLVIQNENLAGGRAAAG